MKTMEKIVSEVNKAKAGDQKALNILIGIVSDKIFNIAVYFLGEHHLAEDATQDILIKIISNFDKLKEPEKFENWSYSLASNHLRNFKRDSKRYAHISFEAMTRDSESHLNMPDHDSKVIEDIKELAYELKVSCTIAMLMCLNKEERLVFLYSCLLKQNSKTGGQLLEISSDNFRKKLSRAKQKLNNFISNNCGLLNPDNSCKCKIRVNYALSQKRISKEKLYYISENYIKNNESLAEKIDKMEELEDLNSVFHNNPNYNLPNEIISKAYDLAKN